VDAVRSIARCPHVEQYDPPIGAAQFEHIVVAPTSSRASWVVCGNTEVCVAMLARIWDYRLTRALRCSDQ